MRPGKVVTIRLNPRDCMGVLDVIDKAGLSIEGASFPALVSLALGSLLQTVRDEGVIPDRAGFEYSEMMAPYHGQRSNRRKLEITDTIHKAGSSIRSRGLSKPAGVLDELKEPAQATAGRTEPVVVNEMSADLRRAGRRLTELLQKKDLAEEPGSGVVWQQSDQEEYDQLYQQVYPNG